MLGKIRNKTLVIGALLFSLASVAIHLYLSFNHYRLKFGLGEGKSLCNINSHLNCDVVTLSNYSTLLGWPIASWAAVTHILLCLLLLLWLIGLLKNADRILRFAFWLACFIALMSVIMGAISSFLLGTFCLFCIGTYVLSLLIWLALGLAVRRLDPVSFSQDFRALFADHRWILISLLLIPGAVYLSNSMFLDSVGLGEVTEMIKESLNTWKTNPQKNFDAEKGLILQTDGSAPKMIIVEFADFLCPHCKAASEPLHNFTQTRKGVRLVYKPFPLDGVCNESGIPKHNGVRCELAYAALCAEELQHKGWETADYIFQHQMDWNPISLDADLTKLATDLNLDSAPFKECRQKAETHQKLLDLAKEGSGIQGTPTIFVNGRELPHGASLPVLDGAAAELGL